MRGQSSLSVCLLALVAATFVACAFGAEDVSGDDDSPSGPDARDVTIDGPPLPIDSAPPIDSSVPIDAPIPIDAAVPADGGTGLFCNSTADCAGQPGTCCFFIAQPPGFCVPGSEPLPGVCLPS